MGRVGEDPATMEVDEAAAAAAAAVPMDGVKTAAEDSAEAMQVSDDGAGESTDDDMPPLDDGEDVDEEEDDSEDDDEPMEPQRTALEWKEEGNAEYKKKNYSAAIDLYTKAVELAPEEPAYLNNRAAANMMLLQFKDALADATKAVDLDPGNAKYLLRAGKCYLALGRLTDAQRQFEAVLAVEPGNKQAALEKANLDKIAMFRKRASEAVEKKQYNNAISSLDRALEIAPGSIPLKLEQARVYIKRGDPANADRIASGILRSHPLHSEALFVRGLTFYVSSDLEKAQKHFQVALQSDPDHAESKVYLKLSKKLARIKEEGNAAFKAGENDKAKELYSQALTLDPTLDGFNSKLYFNRAGVNAKLGDLEAAIQDCSSALELDDTYQKARLRRAGFYTQTEKYQEAVYDYQSASEADPSNRELRAQLRQAKIELKKSQRKNYYKILGVSQTANEKEIKRAYRKMAMQHHPDRVQGEAEKEAAEAKFQEVGEAYNILSDPQKRARFDRGDDLDEPSGFGGGGFSQADLFAHMFRGGGFGGFGGGGFGGFGHGGYDEDEDDDEGDYYGGGHGHGHGHGHHHHHGFHF